jgi:hypothetical protein
MGIETTFIDDPQNGLMAALVVESVIQVEHPPLHGDLGPQLF